MNTLSLPVALLLLLVASLSQAKTLVSLAPSITELVYAVGADKQLLAVDRYSNYPDSAKTKPSIGDAFNLNYEQLAILKPDVILYWPQGTPAKHIQNLKLKGYNLDAVEVNSLEDLPLQMAKIASIANVDADITISALQERIEKLPNKSQPIPLPTFYKIGHKPIFTVNSQHLVSKTIARCGGKNIFSDSPIYAPQIGFEAILAANPQLIITAEKSEFSDKWKSIAAVKNNKVLVIDPDWLSRPSPRFLFAAEKICQAIGNY